MFPEFSFLFESVTATRRYHILWLYMYLQFTSNLNKDVVSKLEIGFVRRVISMVPNTGIFFSLHPIPVQCWGRVAAHCWFKAGQLYSMRFMPTKNP